MPYAAKKLTGRSYRMTNGLCTELSIPYQVITPRLTAAPGIGDLTGFPTAGQPPGAADYTNLAGAASLVLADVDVSEDDSGIKWIFSAVYRGNAASTYAPLGTETEYSARITHGTKNVEVECAWDWDGKPFLNSAKRPYDNPPKLKYPARVVTVEKMLKAKISVSGVSGTCNVAAVTLDGETFAAGTAMIDATCETSGDKKWPWKLRFTVEELISIDDQGENTGCRVNLVNSGFEYLDATTGKLVRAMIEDEKGEIKPSPTPVLLDAAGERLADGVDTLTSIQYRTARETAWPAWVTA